jgi:hypothetical protein
MGKVLRSEGQKKKDDRRPSHASIIEVGTHVL